MTRKGSLYPQLKHGLSYTPEYRAWQLIRLRCTDPKHAAYPRYGGRGIAMHEPWIEDPASFIAHVGKRPTSKHEIDRIDNDRGYEPGNLRWATRTENSNNRRGNHLVEYLGRTQTLTQWCRELGVPPSVAAKRIEEGWSTERVFETPVRAKRPNGTLVLSAAQLNVLRFLNDAPRTTASHTAAGSVAGLVAKALIARGFARNDGALVAITDEGRAALEVAEVAA